MTEVATAEQSTALAVLEIKNPALVFVKGGGDPIIDHVKAEVKKEQPNLDISTPTGRKAIASLAYKIAQTKSKFDKIGKSLTEEQRAQIDAVNEERKRVEAELQKLQDEVRAPLTMWEEAEKKRVADHEEAIKAISALHPISLAANYPHDHSSAAIQANIDALENMPVRDWQEFEARATFTRKETTEALINALQEQQKKEADAAELARLQKAEADRLQKERDDKIAAEAKAQAEAKAAADAKALAEKVEADKKKAEEDRAALAKTLADALAKAEADKKQAAIDAQKKADDAAAAERKKAADAKAAEEEATKKREADKAHKTKINNEALEKINGILTAGLGKKTEDVAKALVISIAKGEIPHTSIKY